MRKTARSRWVAATGVVIAGALALTACSSDSGSTEEPVASAPAEEAPAEEAPAEEAAASGECTELTPVNLQLQWFAQAQFGGYYAAKDKGYYEAQCLDVTILEGGVDIVPQTALAQGNADFAIAWVPKALASREQGAGIVNVAQVFQRSGTLQVAWADSGITTPADFKGKKIGNSETSSRSSPPSPMPASTRHPMSSSCSSSSICRVCSTVRSMRLRP